MCCYCACAKKTCGPGVIFCTCAKKNATESAFAHAQRKRQQTVGNLCAFAGNICAFTKDSMNVGAKYYNTKASLKLRLEQFNSITFI